MPLLARDRSWLDHTVAGAGCQSLRAAAAGGCGKRKSDITIVMTSSTESPAIIPAKRSIPGKGERGGPSPWITLNRNASPAWDVLGVGTDCAAFPASPRSAARHYRRRAAGPRANRLARRVVAAASAQRVEMVPTFLHEIESYLTLESTDRAKPTPLFFIFHLLGEWREKAAYRLLARLLRCSGHEVDAILGDAITTTTHRVMAAVFDGDPQPLYEIILDPNAEQYVRSRMCEALAMVVFRERWPSGRRKFCMSPRPPARREHPRPARRPAMTALSRTRTNKTTPMSIVA
jgi:hypothetical protein